MQYDSVVVALASFAAIAIPTTTVSAQNMTRNMTGGQNMTGGTNQTGGISGVKGGGDVFYPEDP
jgi:hypothetical protein